MQRNIISKSADLVSETDVQEDIMAGGGTNKTMVKADSSKHLFTLTMIKKGTERVPFGNSRKGEPSTNGGFEFLLILE